MCKKIILLLILLCNFVLQASDLKPWFEIKPSYFFFTSSAMKNIYQHGGFEIQGSGSFPIGKYFDFYGSVGCRRANGHALNTGEKTNLTVVPIDVGLKSVFNFNERAYYFFAMGPRFFYLKQHNYSSYVDQHVKNFKTGLFINTGFNWLFKTGLVLGIFGEYSYEKSTSYPSVTNVFSPGSVQLGGLAFGFSLGGIF